MNFALDDLLPHTGKMRLVDEVLSYEGETARLRLVVRNDGVFNDPALDGDIPAYIGIEYMAQAVAANIGLSLQRDGDRKRTGFLLGTRSYESNVGSFKPGAELFITAERVLNSPEGLGVFDCTIVGSGVSVSAKINGFLPKDSATFWATVAGQPE
jgi:predicted hotdog family 3-hydroxylacyl-ACP dehydratase